MTWEQGSDEIERLFRLSHLERLPGDKAEVRHLITKAASHLLTSAALADADPEIAYDALYAAARKALTALLVQQGLRPTRDGGHAVAIAAAQAQLVPPLGDVLRPMPAQEAARRRPLRRH